MFSLFPFLSPIRYALFAHYCEVATHEDMVVDIGAKQQNGSLGKSDNGGGATTHKRLGHLGHSTTWAGSQNKSEVVAGGYGKHPTLVQASHRILPLSHTSLSARRNMSKIQVRHDYGMAMLESVLGPSGKTLCRRH